MLSYHWNLPFSQPGDNPPLHLLQQALLEAGFLLDLSFIDGMVRLTIQQTECTERNGAGRTEDAAPHRCTSPGSARPHCPAPPDSAGATDCPFPENPGKTGCPSPGGTGADKRPENPKKRRGRPPAVPENDISVRQAEKMRSDGLSLDEIAAHIGVSRRTFFRRWDAAREKKADPEMPFSRWTD